MNRYVFLILAPPALYAAWLGMMAAHEAGHVFHAWASGGDVERVSVPLLGFSQTHYASNPHPHFVAWGGPVWGCLFPLALVAATLRTRGCVRQFVQFFAGFCLLSNGLYLSIGLSGRVGDVGELLKYGTPAWALIVCGVTAAATGLYLWHRLTVRRPRDTTCPVAGAL